MRALGTAPQMCAKKKARCPCVPTAHSPCPPFLLCLSAVGTPVVDVENLTPFGNPIGQANTTYNTWKAGTPNPIYFVVKNVTSCPMDKNCNSDNTLRQSHRYRTAQKKHFWRAYVAGKAEEAAKELMTLANAAAALARM